MPRHLAIGDIHGCYSALRRLIEVVRPQKDDVLIMLGDYVDRGPDSCQVVDWLIEASNTRQLHALRGNHDLMMLEARSSKSAFEKWLKMGGRETLQSYGADSLKRSDLDMVPKAHWDFLSNRLVPYLELDHEFFVHANVDPELPLKEQTDQWLYWKKLQRDVFHCSGKMMVCGHTSQKSGYPKLVGNAICLDSRVFETGWLSCLHVETGWIWQAHQSDRTRHVHLSQLRVPA